MSEHGDDNGGDVIDFPDRRTELRRAQDVADEWLKMVLSSLEQRMQLLESGQYVRDLERRVQALEAATGATSTQVTAWRAQLGLVVFCLTTGVGVTLGALKLLGML